MPVQNRPERTDSDVDRPESPAFRVTFVCTGNICRSPMAEVVFRHLSQQHRLSGQISVDSYGTGDWHVGEPADSRTIVALAAAGYDGTSHRARQFDVSLFESSDLIVYFDNSHERILASLAPDEAARTKLHNIVSFDPSPSGLDEVPDPYYANAALFDSVLELIDRCCRGLFRQIAPALQSAAR